MQQKSVPARCAHETVRAAV